MWKLSWPLGQVTVTADCRHCFLINTNMTTVTQVVSCLLRHTSTKGLQLSGHISSQQELLSKVIITKAVSGADKHHSTNPGHNNFSSYCWLTCPDKEEITHQIQLATEGAQSSDLSFYCLERDLWNGSCCVETKSQISQQWNTLLNKKYL